MEGRQEWKYKLHEAHFKTQNDQMPTLLVSCFIKEDQYSQFQV